MRQNNDIYESRHVLFEEPMQCIPHSLLSVFMWRHGGHVSVPRQWNSLFWGNDASFTLRKRSFISTLRPTVHTDLSQKRSLSKTVFKREKYDFGRKNSLKTKLVENYDFTTIIWFPCPCFPLRRIQNYPCLLRFEISLAECGRSLSDFSSLCKNLPLFRSIHMKARERLHKVLPRFGWISCEQCCQGKGIQNIELFR